jgi:hypothetical protein
VLPEFTGTLMRDGYAGYAHLPAVHAWCAAHLLRDLRALSDADPLGQLWDQAQRHHRQPRPMHDDQPRTSCTYYFCGPAGLSFSSKRHGFVVGDTRELGDGSVALHNSRGAVCTGGPMGIAGCPPTVNGRVGACGAHQRPLCAGALPGTEVDHD